MHLVGIRARSRLDTLAHAASSRRAKAALFIQGESEQLCLWQLEQSWHPFTKYQEWALDAAAYQPSGVHLQPGWEAEPLDRSQEFFFLAFVAIMWEVMSFSLVFSPYNSPPFASKQAQWSKLENVMPVKNEPNTNVYFPRSAFSDPSLDSHMNLVWLFPFSEVIDKEPGQ